MAKKPASKDWHWADIKAAIGKSRFKSFENLAQHYKLKSVGSLRGCKDKPYAAAERRIASAIGVKPEIIWPSRWHPDGRRKSRAEMDMSLGRKSIPIVRAANVNKSPEV